ncbi:MAG: Type IV pilus assembly protein PilM [Candidatus Beckwithbacteria bacterium GW2011_GWC2_47_9]|uniref:Type IV pilus assembly protein PilM n=1 Tax=Candidatus Beckwithbacteria bacterium GW2011_GWC2_47_9 TaxID=1618373 RepID=A0A0G1WAD4_9BACT|nr:MAG: Type IV pilus assembly protein PilM [Parcubacteria group bacterium GW2011_GWA2_47_21]KKU87293.1 MAG: Type IV pilus assembly protein PilM [Candidatus Beckwithbacteria bacterium GW2011_GWC2_47_9]
MPAVGFDIGDDAVRFIELKKTNDGFKVGRFGERINPVLRDRSADITKNGGFRGFLSSLREAENLGPINASLPEDKAYLFATELVGVDSSLIRSAIEFRLEEFVPIPAKDAIFDYEIIPSQAQSGAKTEVGVAVLPKSIVLSYLEMFQSAGFTPLSFEVAGQAIAKAVVKRGDQRTRIIVYFGKSGSTIFVVKGGAVLFSSAVSVGGDALTGAFAKDKSVSIALAEKFKWDKGLQFIKGDIENYAAVLSLLASVKEELNRVLSYWKTKKTKEANDKNEDDKIRSIIFCGPEAGLPGLIDYFKIYISVPSELADVWVNVLDVNENIPPISFSKSLAFAAAIGLALSRSRIA